MSAGLGRTFRAIIQVCSLVKMDPAWYVKPGYFVIIRVRTRTRIMQKTFIMQKKAAFSNIHAEHVLAFLARPSVALLLQKTIRPSKMMPLLYEKFWVAGTEDVAAIAGWFFVWGTTLARVAHPPGVETRPREFTCEGSYLTLPSNSNELRPLDDSGSARRHHLCHQWLEKLTFAFLLPIPYLQYVRFLVRQSNLGPYLEKGCVTWSC